MNWSQLSGVVERVVLVALTWLASKGYISSGEVANIGALVLAVAGAAYAYFVNRNTNLVKQAASVPGTVVVTQPALADATPNQTNVVSSEESKVVPK